MQVFGAIDRSVQLILLRRMLDAPVPGKKRRGRHKTRWKDLCKRDMENVGLKEDDALDRATSKNDIKTHSGDPRRWEKPEEKKNYFYHTPNPSIMITGDRSMSA